MAAIKLNFFNTFLSWPNSKCTFLKYLYSLVLSSSACIVHRLTVTATRLTIESYRPCQNSNVQWSLKSKHVADHAVTSSMQYPLQTESRLPAHVCTKYVLPLRELIPKNINTVLIFFGWSLQICIACIVLCHCVVLYV